jgi:hypothetical protein
VPVGLDEVHSAFQIARLIEGRGAVGAFARSARVGDPVRRGLHPLMAAERVQRAVRSGCPLDPDGAETLHATSTAVRAVSRR